MTIEKLKVALKLKLRVFGIATLFLMGTTFVSLILIIAPTWLSPNIYLENFHFGSAILGSIMGQVTILVVMSYTKKKSVKTILKGLEDLDFIDVD